MFKQFLLFALVSVVVTLSVRNHPFFWDTVQLASKHGHFFYENGFSSLILPEEIDSGHLPAFGLYIAFSWKIFGKTLAVSHLAMLPFLLGIGYFMLKLGRMLAGPQKAPLLLVLCFADPVLASQAVLVSPDVALVCFFLMGLQAIILQRPVWVLAVAVLGLGLVSMRGMMVGAGLYFFSVITFWKSNSNDPQTSLPGVFVKKIWPFLPGGFMAAGYLYYHWQQTGWIGHHAESPWALSYEQVDLQGFVKNIAVLGWRMLDFGRVFVWLVLLFFLREIFQKNQLEKWSTLHQLVSLCIVVFVVTVPLQMIYSGLLAHRYLLPLFLSLHLLLFLLLFGNEGHRKASKAVRSRLAVVVVTGLLVGNLWIYPKKISQGWDSTLAHLHWYCLIEEAMLYLNQQHIPLQDVGTAFPNIGPREWYQLDGRQTGFVEKDLSRQCFILYSNVMNDFTDGEIDELESRWQAVFHQEKMGVCVIIYKNPNHSLCEN